MANEEEALVDVVENGEIVAEETPSRKRKQSKGLMSGSITQVSRENRPESFASFRGNLEYLRSSVPVRYY